VFFIFCAILRKAAIISLNSSNRLVFVMRSRCVFRETGIIQISHTVQSLKYTLDVNVDYIKKIIISRAHSSVLRLIFLPKVVQI